MKRSTKLSRRSVTSRGRLGVQHLESRKLMAADIGLSDSVLSIQGSDTDDIAEVYVDSDRVYVSVSSYDAAGEMISQRSEEFAVDEIGRIIFSAGAGNDMLVNDSAIPVIARGGSGDDTLLGGTANDVLIGGTGDDFIHGGGGDDMILGGPGENTIVSLGSDDAQTDIVDSPIDETTNDSQDVDQPVNDTPVGETEVTADALASESPVDTVVPVNTVVPVDTVTPADDATDEALEPVGETVAETVDNMNACIAEDATSSSGETETIEMDVEATTETEVAATAIQEVIPTEPESPNSDAEPTAEPLAEDLPNTPIDQTIESATNDLADSIEPEFPNNEVLPNNEVAPSNEVDDANVISDPDVVAELDAPAAAETDHDIIFGGPGDDWLLGEGGDDLIFGNDSPLEALSLRALLASRFSF